MSHCNTAKLEKRDDVTEVLHLLFIAATQLGHTFGQSVESGLARRTD